MDPEQQVRADHRLQLPGRGLHRRVPGARCEVCVQDLKRNILNFVVEIVDQIHIKTSA